MSPYVDKIVVDLHFGIWILSFILRTDCKLSRY